MSNYDNMDVMIGSENIILIGRELANAIEGSINNEDSEFNSHLSGNSFQEIEIRDHYSAYASYFAACRGIRDTQIQLLVHYDTRTGKLHFSQAA